MIEKYLNKFLGDYWFRRGLACSVLFYTFHLTNWGAKFAEKALSEKADLVGTAGILTALAAIPLGLLTLVFNKYTETKTNDSGN